MLYTTIIEQEVDVFTEIYTYKNFKKVYLKAERFHLVHNKEEFDNLIEAFLDFDAVATPYFSEEAPYPLVLELTPGFAVNFVEVKKKRKNEVEQVLKEASSVSQTTQEILKVWNKKKWNSI